MKIGKITIAATLFALMAACGGGSEDGDSTNIKDVLPEGSESMIQSALEDSTIRAMVEGADGVDGRVALKTGIDGTRYWDFGETVNFAVPVYLIGDQIDGVFQREDYDGTRLHNSIVDLIPGEPGYSPFWVVNQVWTTEKYNGELITSVEGMFAAIEAGLLDAPRIQDFAVNCPGVSDGISLEMPNTLADLQPNREFYWKGKTLPYFDLGMMPLVEGPISNTRAVPVSGQLTANGPQFDGKRAASTVDRDNNFPLIEGTDGAVYNYAQPSTDNLRPGLNDDGLDN